MLRVILAGLILALAGCATNNPRFQTETPSDQITGEKVCEVPQHWKALALEGVDTRKLTQATVVHVRIPAEWIGDALGWFVAGEDTRLLDHYPRLSWTALVTNRDGKQFRFPAVIKNPLVAPYLTVVMNDQLVRPGEKVTVYVPSGAVTRLLTTAGDRLRLSSGQDCLEMVTTEFIRTFPSELIARSASTALLTEIRTDFPRPGLHDDGKIYANHRLVNRYVVGDLRQVNRVERTAERGAPVALSPLTPIPTAITGIVNLGAHVLSEERYAGPFGERLYSATEARAALTSMLRGYNRERRDLEQKAGVPYSSDLSFNLDFEGRKSGWEIGEMIALQVEEAWKVLGRLQERAQYRRNK